MNSISSGTHFHCGTGSGSFQGSPFSAFHFLRNYNYLLPTDPTDISAKHLLTASRLFTDCSIPSSNQEKLVSFLNRTDSERTPPTIHNKPLTYWQQTPLLQTELPSSKPSVISPCTSIFGNNLKRQRGEKKPIPEEQKDDKYFERRRRNNQAAKKSRDARKIREDQVALKATLLEHENAILRAQVLTLREETTTLRQLLMEKKVTDF